MKQITEYQTFVEKTCTYRDNVYPVLGLAGETGEFLELVKKAWRDHDEFWADYIDKDKAISELGDILWYITRIASILDIDMESIINGNVEKLLDRKKNGKK